MLEKITEGLSKEALDTFNDVIDNFIRSMEPRIRRTENSCE